MIKSFTFRKKRRTHVISFVALKVWCFIGDINIQKTADNASEITDEEDLETLPSDKTFETARDTLKSVSPNYDFSKSEVDESNSEGFGAEAAKVTTKASSPETKEILHSQPESLTPLDFTKLNITLPKDNQDCFITSVSTNPIITQSQVTSGSGSSQKSMYSNSSRLGTPSAAGTPKTPSPRLRSLLSMAGYSSQDIQDASSPVTTPSQMKNIQEKLSDTKTTSADSDCTTAPVRKTTSNVLTLSESNVTSSSSDVLNSLVFRQAQVWVFVWLAY